MIFFRLEKNILENTIIKLKSEIEELKQWKNKYNKDLENIIKEKEKEKEMFKNINLSSSIIKDKKDIYFLEERLKKMILGKI